MKYLFLLCTILLSSMMLSTTYSQNINNDKNDLIASIRQEQKIAFDYYMGAKKDEKDADKKAIEYYEKAVKDMQALTDDEITGCFLDIAYSFLGGLYSTHDNHKKALECYLKSFKYKRFKSSEDVIIIENLYIKNAERGWEPVGVANSKLALKDNNGGMYFYNAKKIKKTNGIIKVWIKRDDTGIKPLTTNEMFKTEEATREFYELLEVKFPYIVSLEEYDCNKQKHRALKAIWYNEDGNLTDSADYENAKWEDIIPDTIGELILEFFCK